MTKQELLDVLPDNGVKILTRSDTSIQCLGCRKVYCYTRLADYIQWKYCPNCGAKIIDDLETSKYKLSQDEIMTLEKWNDDADYVWSENTNQWNDENDFRLFLNDYFMKDIQIKFNIFDYETIIIDSEAKLVIPLLETLKEDK